MTTEQRLSEYLAQRIFDAPRPRKRINRIVFMAGTDNAETDVGGFSKGALADHIREALRDYQW